MKIKLAIISTISLLGIAFLAKHTLLTKEAQRSFLHAMRRSRRALDVILDDYSGNGDRKNKNVLSHQAKVEKEWLKAINQNKCSTYELKKKGLVRAPSLHVMYRICCAQRTFLFWKSCPQAASMSAPRERRIVASTPTELRLFTNSCARAGDVGWNLEPSISLS